MFLNYFLPSLFLLIVILENFINADDGDDEECSCVDLDMETIKTCKDWEDAPVKFDVTLEVKEHHGSLSGKIIANEEISEGVQIVLVILLITPNGEELVYSAAADLCQTLKDSKAPWYPIIQVFNTTECPIPKGEYKVDNIAISLASVKEFCTKDFVGVYSLTISVELTVEKFMCFVLGAEIYEETRRRSECPNPQDD